jgi:hypothetical protein
MLWSTRCEMLEVIAEQSMVAQLNNLTRI